MARTAFAVYVDGRFAGLVAYIPAKGLLAFVHTEVLPEREGQGIGSALARAFLEMVRWADLKVPARLPFRRRVGGPAPRVRAVALLLRRPRQRLRRRAGASARRSFAEVRRVPGTGRSRDPHHDVDTSIIRDIVDASPNGVGGMAPTARPRCHRPRLITHVTGARS